MLAMPTSSLRCAALRCAAVAVVLALAPAAAAQEAACRTAFDDAEATYRNGDFDETIERLQTCLNREAFSTQDQGRAHRLIGLSYIGKAQEQDARAAVRALLDLAPGYQPDPILDPPPFVALVDEMREEKQRAAAQAPRAVPLPSPTARASTTTGLALGGALRGTSFANEDGSNGGGGVQLGLGYGVSQNLSVRVQLGFSGLSDDEADVSYVLGEAAMGGRFSFGSPQSRFVPYAEATGSYQTSSTLGLGSVFVQLDDGTTVLLEDVELDYAGPGVAVGGGLLYFLTPTLALDIGLSAVFSSLTVTVSADDAFGGRASSDESDSFTTVHLGAGFSLNLNR